MEDVEKHHSCIMTYSNLPPVERSYNPNSFDSNGSGKVWKATRIYDKKICFIETKGIV